MDLIPNEIVKIIMSFLDNDMDFFNFLITSKKFSTMTNFRYLKQPYDIEKILEKKEIYIFEHVLYDLNPNEINVLKKYGMLQNIIPPTVKRITVGNKYQDNLQEIYNLTHVKNIHIDMFYHNEEALVNIPSHLDKRDFLATLITNITCWEAYHHEIMFLQNNCINLDLSSIFNDININNTCRFKCNEIIKHLSDSGICNVYYLVQVTSLINEITKSYHKLPTLLQTIESYKKYYPIFIIKEDSCINNKLIIDFLNLIYIILSKQKDFLEKLISMNKKVNSKKLNKNKIYVKNNLSPGY